MVQEMPHHSSPRPEPMLDVVWRSAAYRVSLSGIVASILVGLVGAITLAAADRFWPIASACVVLCAFGMYAAIVQPDLGGARLGASVQRLLATLIATIAVLAAIATGLLLLATIFGGSLEVMRR
jgi:hypothetical protein